MSLFIGLLTAVLVLDSVVLILLVLVQLPKKEAGAGLAFGGSAADALFGAGSGNVLTKATKYAATIFFALTIILSMLNTHVNRQKNVLTLPPPSATTLPSASPTTVPNAPVSAPTAPPAAPSAPSTTIPSAPVSSPTTPPATPGTPSPAPATPNP